MRNEITRRFVNNVRVILSHNNVSIGEFERKIGRSVGWLSRTGSTSSQITLDAAYRIAAELRVPFSEIMDKDWSREYEREKIQNELAEINARKQALEAELERV